MGGHGGSSGFSKSNIAGQNGNPWPPDGSDNHLAWQNSKGIYDQLGSIVTGLEADEMYSSLYNFTGNYYEEIREAQRNGDTTSEYGKKSVTLESFIAKSIESGNGWDGGATYRGIDGISDEAFANLSSLKPGDQVDPNFGGSASWSTKRDIAEHGFSGGKNSVIFVHTGNSQMGVSVKNMSAYGPDENEVLVSKNAKYKVQQVVPAHSGTNDTKYTYVYVESDN